MKQMARDQIMEGLGFILSVIRVLEDFEIGNDMITFISLRICVTTVFRIYKKRRDIEDGNQLGG